MDISIVIVTYNNKLLIGDTLQSIYKSQNNCSYEIIVVDNNSSDGTPPFVEESFPEARVIRSHKNLGFSKANNLGIRASSGKFILMLNPDVIVFDGVLDKMCGFMEAHTNCGIASCKLLNTDGSIQYSVRRFAGFIDILLARTPLKKLVPGSVTAKISSSYLMKDWDHNDTREVDWFLGAFMFMRREALEKSGFLNEKYFMYFEDVELCYRIKKSGYKVMYYHDPSIVHIYGRDSTKGFSLLSVIHLSSCFKFYTGHWRLLFHTLYSYKEKNKESEVNAT